MQEQIELLLKEVAFKNATLKQARERFADRLAPDFSIFDYLRTDEMGLSRCIASLLDPKGKHGQKEIFLELFLEKIQWKGNARVGWVNLENQANGQRRIDIYLQFQNGDIIGIENKPWAGDQENQLSDYAAFIQKEAKGNKWLLIYLSNNEPSDYSGTKKEVFKKIEREGRFKQLRFSEIIEWLEDCACKSRALIVRLFIEELAKFIRMNVNGELDMSEENEIRNLILASTQNLESAFHVSIALMSVKKSLLKEFHDDLKEKVEGKGFELIWDDAMSKDWKRYCGFGVKLSREQNLYLRFEFNSSGLHDLYWGIRRESDLIRKDDGIWSRVNAVMSDQFGSGKKTEWWPWWNWIDEKEFSDEYRNWDSSEVPWVSIKEGELAEKIVDLACRTNNAFGPHQSRKLLSGDTSSDIPADGSH
ncbi:MAG: hypothetical protein E6Q60_08465 [Nitrosomonas oligotropha]|uniref:PD-(D/E)XK nuclease superfamily protein n=1 Tax=Nitrosomonas oligotropha TaxID=42354 RepID=A0A5C7VUU8_9PROT|nr:MAG: hypothetical protein E6Q60_08465 [Nitrosomonas oligotropha]